MFWRTHQRLSMCLSFNHLLSYDWIFLPVIHSVFSRDKTIVLEKARHNWLICSSLINICVRYDGNFFPEARGAPLVFAVLELRKLHHKCDLTIFFPPIAKYNEHKSLLEPTRPTDSRHYSRKDEKLLKKALKIVTKYLLTAQTDPSKRKKIWDF